MIPARKGGVAQRLIEAYVNRKVRRAFRGVWRRGALPVGREPVLVYANHTSFWDGFVAHQISRLAGWDGYCMMEEHNLRRYRFLARIGAFSVVSGDGYGALAPLRYATRLLRRPGTAVFLFPEGRIGPFGVLPLHFEPGMEVLARRSGARCLPLALRYVMLEHELPDVLVEVGAPHAPEPLASCRRRSEELVARLVSTRSTDDFELAVRGRRSVAERWDAVRGLAPCVPAQRSG